MSFKSFFRSRSTGNGETSRSRGGNEKFIGTDPPMRPTLSRRLREQQKRASDRLSLMIDDEIRHDWCLWWDWVDSQPQTPASAKPLELSRSQELMLKERHKRLMGGCWVAPSPEMLDFTLPDQLEGQVAENLSRGAVRFVRRPGVADSPQNTLQSLASNMSSWSDSLAASLRSSIDRIEEVEGDFVDVNLDDPLRTVSRPPIPEPEWSPTIMHTVLPLIDFTEKRETIYFDCEDSFEEESLVKPKRISEGVTIEKVIEPCEPSLPSVQPLSRPVTPIATVRRDSGIGSNYPDLNPVPSSQATVIIPRNTERSPLDLRRSSSVMPRNPQTIQSVKHRAFTRNITNKPHPVSIPVSISSVDVPDLSTPPPTQDLAIPSPMPRSLTTPILFISADSPEPLCTSLHLSLPAEPRMNGENGEEKKRERKNIPPMRPPPVEGTPLPPVPVESELSAPFKKVVKGENIPPEDPLSLPRCRAEGDFQVGQTVATVSSARELVMPSALLTRRKANTPHDTRPPSSLHNVPSSATIRPAKYSAPGPSESTPETSSSAASASAPAKRSPILATSNDNISESQTLVTQDKPLPVVNDFVIPVEDFSDIDYYPFLPDFLIADLDTPVILDGEGEGRTGRYSSVALSVEEAEALRVHLEGLASSTPPAPQPKQKASSKLRFLPKYGRTRQGATSTTVPGSSSSKGNQLPRQNRSAIHTSASSKPSTLAKRTEGREVHISSPRPLMHSRMAADWPKSISHLSPVSSSRSATAPSPSPTIKPPRSFRQSPSKVTHSSSHTSTTSGLPRRPKPLTRTVETTLKLQSKKEGKPFPTWK